MMLHSLVAGLGLLAAPCLAIAQDQTPEIKAKTVGPQDLTRATNDPVDKIVGIWRVDKVDGGTTSDTLRGSLLKIDRQSVTTLESGTCTNPSFAEQLGSIAVACLGQSLASATWDPQEPGRLQWSEGGLAAVLHRISGTETLQSPASEGEPAAPADAGGSGQGSEDEGDQAQ